MTEQEQIKLMVDLNAEGKVMPLGTKGGIEIDAGLFENALKRADIEYAVRKAGRGFVVSVPDGTTLKGLCEEIGLL